MFHSFARSRAHTLAISAAAVRIRDLRSVAVKNSFSPVLPTKQNWFLSTGLRPGKGPLEGLNPVARSRGALFARLITTFAGVWLARDWRARNVFLGSWLSAQVPLQTTAYFSETPVSHFR